MLEIGNNLQGRRGNPMLGRVQSRLRVLQAGWLVRWRSDWIGDGLGRKRNIGSVWQGLLGLGVVVWGGILGQCARKVVGVAGRAPRNQRQPRGAPVLLND